MHHTARQVKVQMLGLELRWYSSKVLMTVSTVVSACPVPTIPHSYLQMQLCKADTIVYIMQTRQERYNKVTCPSQGQRIGKGQRWYFKTQLYLLFDMLTSVEHLCHYFKHSKNSDAILYLLGV